MKLVVFVILLAALAVGALPAQTAAKAVKATSSAVSVAPQSGQDMNIREYIELLRTDVKKQKAQIVGDVMQLDAGLPNIPAETRHRVFSPRTSSQDARGS